MDGNKVVEALRATLQPETQKEAESYLNEVHKIINFAPTLLQIMSVSEMDVTVRQAAAIYLKNLIVYNWSEKEASKPNEPIPFSLHENDKQNLREHIIQALVESPFPIRVQLKDALQIMIKADFPGKWEVLPQQIHQYLLSENRAFWSGALFCLHNLVAAFEYTTKEESREPLFQSLNLWMPVVKQRLNILLQEPISEENASIENRIIKIFHALVQFSLPVALLNKEEISQWIQIMLIILKHPIPDELMRDMDESDKEQTSFWKAKKWCIKTLYRLFERYGSPGNVIKQYEEFAVFFLGNYSSAILESLFGICEAYRQKVFVSKAVLRYTLNYLEDAIKHAFCWKFIKPHFELLIRDVMFPLLCHTDENEELFRDDPLQYIRESYDIFEEVSSPVSYASSFMGSVASKRKNVLKMVMDFSLSILNSDQATPRQKDGALHMIGSVSKSLLKKKMYRNEVEQFLQRIVLPILQASEGYRRARALWLLGQMAKANFSHPQSIEQALLAAYDRFVNDPDLPVQLEAILCINELLESHEEIRPILKPYIAQIVISLLRLIRATFIDEIATALRNFIDFYDEDIVPVACEIMLEMVSAFHELLVNSVNESGKDKDAAVITNGIVPPSPLTQSVSEQLLGDISDEKVLTLNGLLQTIDLILMSCEEKKELMRDLEVMVVQKVLVPILQGRLEALYDECLSLVESLTSATVSSEMWAVFEVLIYAMNDYKDMYFTDYSPCLYNFLVVDKDQLRTRPQCFSLIIDLFRRILTSDTSDEDEECHAAKLLEVLLLEHRAFLDTGTIVGVLETVIGRLTRDIVISELRVMCLQVVIAAIYCQPQEMITFLMQHPWPGDSTTSIFHHLLQLWLADVDCFFGIHDRKMSILGLLALLAQPNATRPAILQTDTTISQKLLPSLLMLLDGITKAYENRAKDEDSDSEEEDDEEEAEDTENTKTRKSYGLNKELESDEDDVDTEAERYISYLAKDADEDDSDDDYDDMLDSETALEGFKTHLDEETCDVDEYVAFVQTMEQLKSQDTVWFEHLTAQLNPEQKKTWEEVFSQATRRHQKRMSEAIEKAGGYNFQQTNVPTNFNFLANGAVGDSSTQVFMAGRPSNNS